MAVTIFVFHVKLLLNLRLDYHRFQFEYAEVIEIIKEMKEAEVLLTRKRLPELQAFFEDCPSPDLKKSFQARLELQYTQS